MEPIITSAANGTIKHIRKLVASSKARREAGEYVAEGIHLVRSFLTSDSTPKLYVCAESALKNPEVTELLQQLEKTSAQRIIVADSLFESLSSVHASVGILIVFAAQPQSDSSEPLTQTTVILEDIQDPGNLGTILRTAAAVGVQDIVVSPGCTSPWSPKALRAGMGAQFGLHIQEATDLPNLVRTATIPTFATTLSSHSVPLYSLQLAQPVAWIFGNEGQGVSSALAQAASQTVLIPQADTPVESLNVAAAAAVCLYEQYRQTVAN